MAHDSLRKYDLRNAIDRIVEQYEDPSWLRNVAVAQREQDEELAENYGDTDIEEDLREKSVKELLKINDGISSLAVGYDDRRSNLVGRDLHRRLKVAVDELDTGDRKVIKKRLLKGDEAARVLALGRRGVMALIKCLEGNAKIAVSKEKPPSAADIEENYGHERPAVSRKTPGEPARERSDQEDEEHGKVRDQSFAKRSKEPQIDSATTENPQPLTSESHAAEPLTNDDDGVPETSHAPKSKKRKRNKNLSRPPPKAETPEFEGFASETSGPSKQNKRQKLIATTTEASTISDPPDLDPGCNIESAPIPTNSPSVNPSNVGIGQSTDGFASQAQGQGKSRRNRKKKRQNAEAKQVAQNEVSNMSPESTAQSKPVATETTQQSSNKKRRAKKRKRSNSTSQAPSSRRGSDLLDARKDAHSNVSIRKSSPSPGSLERQPPTMIDIDGQSHYAASPTTVPEEARQVPETDSEDGKEEEAADDPLAVLSPLDEALPSPSDRQQTTNYRTFAVHPDEASGNDQAESSDEEQPCILRSPGDRRRAKKRMRLEAQQALSTQQPSQEASLLPPGPPAALRSFDSIENGRQDQIADEPAREYVEANIVKEDEPTELDASFSGVAQSTDPQESAVETASNAEPLRAQDDRDRDDSAPAEAIDSSPEHVLHPEHHSLPTPSESPLELKAKRKSTGLRSSFFKTSPITKRTKTPVETRPASASPIKPKTRTPAGTSVIAMPPLTNKTFGLIQEVLYEEPLHLIVATILLNKTSGRAAIPALFQLLEKYPDAEALASASETDLLDFIGFLGLQNNRAKRLVELGKMWLADPPTQAKRHRSLGYPNPGDGSDIGKDEIVGPEERDPRKGAWEVAHLAGVGKYALDSWRIFCRDQLRGLADDYNGKNAKPTRLGIIQRKNGHEAQVKEHELEVPFEPEWKRVLPQDKELRAFLRWMWLKEGFEWNPETGEKKRASLLALEKVNRGAEEVEVTGKAGLVGTVFAPSKDEQGQDRNDQSLFLSQASQVHEEEAPSQGRSRDLVEAAHNQSVQVAGIDELDTRMSAQTSPRRSAQDPSTHNSAPRQEMPIQDQQSVNRDDDHENPIDSHRSRTGSNTHEEQDGQAEDDNGELFKVRPDSTRSQSPAAERRSSEDAINNEADSMTSQDETTSEDQENVPPSKYTTQSAIASQESLQRQLLALAGRVSPTALDEYQNRRATPDVDSEAEKAYAEPPVSGSNFTPSIRSTAKESDNEVVSEQPPSESPSPLPRKRRSAFRRPQRRKASESAPDGEETSGSEGYETAPSHTQESPAEDEHPCDGVTNTRTDAESADLMPDDLVPAGTETDPPQPTTPRAVGSTEMVPIFIAEEQSFQTPTQHTEHTQTQLTDPPPSTKTHAPTTTKSKSSMFLLPRRPDGGFASRAKPHAPDDSPRSRAQRIADQTLLTERVGLTIDESPSRETLHGLIQAKKLAVRGQLLSLDMHLQGLSPTAVGNLTSSSVRSQSTQIPRRRAAGSTMKSSQGLRKLGDDGSDDEAQAGQRTEVQDVDQLRAATQVMQQTSAIDKPEEEVANEPADIPDRSAQHDATPVHYPTPRFQAVNKQQVQHSDSPVTKTRTRPSETSTAPKTGRLRLAATQPRGSGKLKSIKSASARTQRVTLPSARTYGKTPSTQSVANLWLNKPGSSKIGRTTDAAEARGNEAMTNSSSSSKKAQNMREGDVNGYDDPSLSNDMAMLRRASEERKKLEAKAAALNMANGGDEEQ